MMEDWLLSEHVIYLHKQIIVKFIVLDNEYMFFKSLGEKYIDVVLWEQDFAVSSP